MHGLTSAGSRFEHEGHVVATEAVAVMDALAAMGYRRSILVKRLNQGTPRRRDAGSDGQVREE